MLILPTKRFTIEYQPDNAKTWFKLEYKIPQPKLMKAATKEQAREMLDMVLRFESNLMNIKRELLAKAAL